MYDCPIVKIRTIQNARDQPRQRIRNTGRVLVECHGVSMDKERHFFLFFLFVLLFFLDRRAVESIMIKRKSKSKLLEAID